MQVFQVHTTSLGANGKTFGFCFTYDGELDQLIQELGERHIIAVDKLRTVDDGRGRRMITGREKVGLGVGAVATIAVAFAPHWEPED